SPRSHSIVAGSERSASFGAGGPFTSRRSPWARLRSEGAVAAMSSLLEKIGSTPNGMTISRSLAAVGRSNGTTIRRDEAAREARRDRRRGRVLARALRVDLHG